MKTNADYIPALRWRGLTPLYDAVLRWVMQEERFKRALIRQAQVQPGQKVLDLGCGTATLTILLKQAHLGAAVTGLDGDPVVLQIGRAKAAKAGVELVLDQGMAYALPYLPSTFDRVVSSLMFHHLTKQNKLQAMKEVYRILKPGGTVSIVDFGPPQGFWSRLVSPLMARLEPVGDNHQGLLGIMLTQAGFKGVVSPLNFSTLFGTLTIYTGYRSS